MGRVSREHFIQQVIDVARSRFPLAKVARGVEPFSIVLNGGVASLENIYRLARLQPDESRRQIERWLVELLRAGEGMPDRQGTFEELKPRILPMLMGKGDPENPDAVFTQPLVDGLRIAYAVDHDRTIAYLSPEWIKRWKISVDLLHETAMENLALRSEQLTAHAPHEEGEAVNLILFQTQDGYDASRLLLPTLHSRLRSYLGSPFAAAVPNRDILLCFRADPEVVSRIHPQVKSDFLQMPHQVSDGLFLVTADGIAPYHAAVP